MKNRKLLLIVSVVLAMTMSLGGTLAYLTDSDGDVNVMTVGRVEIKQNEQKRDGSAFEGQMLLPLVGSTTAKDANGYRTAANYIDKLVTVTNTGNTNAWVRTLIAFPELTHPEYDFAKSSTEVIHWNGGSYTDLATTNPAAVRLPGSGEPVRNNWWWGTETTSDWPGNSNEWNVVKGVMIEGLPYTVHIVTNVAEVTPKETTAPNLFGIYLDSRVDYDYDEKCYTWNKKNITFNDAAKTKLNAENVKIYVLSQAVQASGFENAWDAFEEAFKLGENPATTIAGWFSTVDKDTEGEDNVPPESTGSADAWDGTVDTSWYNEEDTEFVITTAEQLAGLAELVDGGNTFKDKTVKLGQDLDLHAVDEDGNKIGFNPIGHSSNGKSFNGTFDGQEHTISNLYMQNDLGAWQYEGEYYALFAYTNGAAIKNVTVADAYISSGRNEAAAVVGNAVDTTFEDISVESTMLIAYNNSAGGVAAECYGNCSFANITVDEDTVIGPLWGTYDVRLGGVVGMVKSSDTVSFSNVSVSCKLDAINDVAANYQYWLYRYSGMLIGQVDGVNGVADPTGYVTCENVTVTYGDWVNYHYCEDADLGAGSYNGPGEYKYARVEAGTGTDGIDLSKCNHNEDESHNVQIAFDQLFGGGQGVKGLKTYDGVTVNYSK